MTRRIRVIERLERLEDRTCPSGLLAGVSMSTPEAGIEPDVTVSDSEMNRYGWIMMAMSPGEMMKVANEVDQSAKEPGIAMASSGAGSMLTGIVNAKRSGSPAEPAMPESTVMPPAQMVMSPEPLVRPGSSSSRRTLDPMSEMADSNANDVKTNAGKDRQSSMAAGRSPKPADEYEPPRLAPGDLDPRLTPDLGPGAIGPPLEKAVPSEPAP